jgi:hypothetical protein
VGDTLMAMRSNEQTQNLDMTGVFCAEDQPGGSNGGFPHFHRLDAPDYPTATAAHPARSGTG